MTIVLLPLRCRSLHAQAAFESCPGDAVAEVLQAPPLHHLPYCCSRFAKCRSHADHPRAAAPHVAGRLPVPPFCASQPESVCAPVQIGTQPRRLGPAQLYTGADWVGNQRCVCTAPALVNACMPPPLPPPPGPL